MSTDPRTPIIYEPGQCVFVTAFGVRTRLKIMLVTSVQDAEQYQTRSASEFREAALRDEKAKVLWVADEDLTFYKSGQVNGFPILLRSDGSTMGLDGMPLKLQLAKE